jgi:lipopolysaccharide export LptBFGC system permease protein LptF
MFYGIFIQISSLTAVFIILQPQHYDMLIRILIISVSPLIAHFLSLTHTRITNIAFYVICGACLVLTLLNLWMPSLTF